MTLQSNRRDIPTDKSEDEDGALWNRWILSEVLARIYLMTIQGVMELKGHNGYKYWPQDPMDANKSIGEIVSKGFWDLCALFTMSMELHPKGNPYIHEPVPFSRLEGKGPIDTNIPPAKFELVDNGYGYLNLLPSDNDHRAVIGLLEALGHKNLIHPLEPALSGISRLQKRLKGTIDIPCVNPELVRSSLRTADAALAATSYLSTLTNESSTLCEVVNSLLVSFILSDNPTIDALSGCYILVLANATLAPIFSSTALSSIRPPSRRRFIIARPSDRGPWDLSYGLLEFRKDLLVHQNVAQRLWDTLKDSPCNVTVAQWDDIPWLFDQFHTLPPSDKQAMLHELWACLNRLPPEEISSFLAKTTIPLLAVRDPTVTGNQAYSYMRWKDFQTYENGVVLEQDSLPQNVISKTYVCYMQNFPGLQLVDQRTFPSFMGEQESFLSPQGAYRLLRAIEAVSLRLQSAFQYFQSNEHYEVSDRETLLRGY